MCYSVPSLRYSSVCNVLCLWKISLIPIYRIYLLYAKKLLYFKRIDVEMAVHAPVHAPVHIYIYTVYIHMYIYILRTSIPFSHVLRFFH